MKNGSLHQQFRSLAKQAGFMSTSYWSVINCGLSNDRTPEIKTGFLEGAGYA